MDRKAEEASEVQRKRVVILSDRSREIIRLFEERERKRPSGFGFFGSHAISTNSFKAEIDAEPEAPPLLKLTGYFKNQEGCRHTRNESAVFKFSYFTRKKDSCNNICHLRTKCSATKTALFDHLVSFEYAVIFNSCLIEHISRLSRFPQRAVKELLTI
jgi:hypothetical protein